MWAKAVSRWAVLVSKGLLISISLHKGLTNLSAALYELCEKKKESAQNQNEQQQDKQNRSDLYLNNYKIEIKFGIP